MDASPSWVVVVVAGQGQEGIEEGASEGAEAFKREGGRKKMTEGVEDGASWRAA